MYLRYSLIMTGQWVSSKVPAYVIWSSEWPLLKSDNRSCNLVILNWKTGQMIQSEKNRSKQITQFDEAKRDKIHFPLLQPKIEYIFHKFRDKTNRQSWTRDPRTDFGSKASKSVSLTWKSFVYFWNSLMIRFASSNNSSCVNIKPSEIVRTEILELH